LKSPKKNIGIIILAAGASRRLGQPKQLVSIKNKLLLQHAIDIGTSISPHTTAVILGANNEKIKPKVNFYSSHIIINLKWNEGISSSIRSGINYFEKKHPSIENLLFLVCDQIYLSKTHLTKMIESHIKNGSKITCSSYKKEYGVPVIFNNQLFDSLKKLNGDYGAKNILKKNMKEIKAIPFIGGEYDIDTPEDYIQINKHIHTDKN